MVANLSHAYEKETSSITEKRQKQKHLEKLATKMLDEQDKLNQLKSKNINTDFLNLF